MKLPLTISTTIFFLIILISAPFFQIQTKQDGINRVLANDFQASITQTSIVTTTQSAFIVENGVPQVNFEVQQHPEVTPTAGQFTHSQESGYYRITSNWWNVWPTISFDLPEVSDYLITLRLSSSGTTSQFNRTDLYLFSPSINLSDEIFRTTQPLGEILDLEILVQNTDSFYISIRNGQGDTSSVSELRLYEITFQKIVEQVIVEPSLNYYQIFENARTAEYSNVDGFMGTIYALPEYANRLYQFWARFTTPTDLLPDSINPLKIVDEQTGRYRDITYDEIQSNWLLRFFGRFVNFTEEFIAGE